MKRVVRAADAEEWTEKRETQKAERGRGRSGGDFLVTEKEDSWGEKEKREGWQTKMHWG